MPPRDVSVRHFQPDDEPSMNDVIKRAFKNPGANAYPLPPGRFVIVAEIAGEIVGHVSIRPMLFRLHGKVERGNVLHMVGTDPSHQHRGIGLKMLDGVVEVLERERMTVSVLDTPIPGFYAARGWVPLAPRRAITLTRAQVDAMRARHEDPGDLVIDDLHPDQAPAHASFHEDHVLPDVLSAVRNVPYMTRVIERHSRGIVWFCHRLTRGGRIAGHVFGERAGSGKEGEALAISIKSWAMDRASPGVVARILSHLLAFDDEFMTVEIRLPVGPAIQQAILSGGGMMNHLQGNIDMALWPAGAPVDPSNVSPDYEQGLFQTHLADMNIS